MSGRKFSLPWAQINRIGAGELEVKLSKFKAAGYGGVAAAAAGALLAGPVGIIAAAGVGAVLGGVKRQEVFEIWTADGKYAVIKGPSGASKQARAWKDMAAQLASARPE